MNTFGVDFHEHLKATKRHIPIIVTKCINEIDERGKERKSERESEDKEREGRRERERERERGMRTSSQRRENCIFRDKPLGICTCTCKIGIAINWYF